MYKQSRRDWFLVAAYIVGAANIVALGIYGYYIPANVRIGLQIPMLLTVVSLCVMALLWRPKQTGNTPVAIPWGILSLRGNSTLVFWAFVVTALVGLGGYLRSSVKLYWHITDVLRDHSPWAFTHSIGFAINLITLNALIFWLGIALIFWMVRKGANEFAHYGVAPPVATLSLVTK